MWQQKAEGVCVCVCVCGGVCVLGGGGGGVIIHGLQLLYFYCPCRSKFQTVIWLLAFTCDHNIITSLFLPLYTHTGFHTHTDTHTHTHTHRPYEFGLLCRPSGLWMIPEVDITSHDRHQRITQLRMCLDSPTLTSLKATISTADLEFLRPKVKCVCGEILPQNHTWSLEDVSLESE